MVNNQKNVSLYEGEEPPADGCSDGERDIPGGPLYSFEQLEPIFRSCSIVAVTSKAKRDVANLKLDAELLAALACQAVRDGRYNKSCWCRTGNSGAWAACDAYTLRRTEWIESARRELSIEYYVKFAIGRTGKVLLMVSMHV